jgi:putative ABC transport system permease protein
MLPFSYLLRNLLRRRIRTFVTIAGVAATTLLVIGMSAFAFGMREAAEGNVRHDSVYLLGSSAEVDLVRSVVKRGHAEVAAASAPNVLTVGNRRAASVELHIATRNGNQIGLLRGVTDAAYLAHPQVTVIEGREPRAPFEIMIGALAAARMSLTPEEVAVGKTIELERRDFTIVGHFSAPGTVYEAELWARLADVMLSTKREDVSCVVLRLDNANNLKYLNKFAGERVDLEIDAVTEPQLMKQLASSLTPIAELALWMAVMAVVAGAFACANTMFAAVLARTRELATLRALGYSPTAIAIGLIQESVLVAFLGGAIGTLIALGIGDVSLRYPMGAMLLQADLTSRAIGLSAALISGLLGGIVPAVRAVRLPLVEAIGGRA